MMLEAAAQTQATPAPSEANDAAARSAVDGTTSATATALPTPDPALKAGEVGEASAPDAPAAAPPAPTQAVEFEAEESDQALADAIEPLPQEQATRRESRWTARPLQMMTAALGVLALGLGVLTLRARRPT